MTKRLAEPLPPFEYEVADTSAFLGKKECNLAMCAFLSIDEQNLQQCEELLLQNAAVTAIDTRYLGNLIRLDAWCTPLAFVDTNYLPRLQELDISYTRILSIDTTHLHQLTQLKAAGSYLERLETRPLTALRSLIVPNTKLTELDLTPLTNLDVFQSQGSCLRVIKANVLPCLNYVCFARTEVSSFSGYFQRLACFRASSSKIQRIDERFMPNLQQLDISNTAIETVNANSLCDLRCLNVQHSKVKALDLRKHVHLERLLLSNTVIRTISLAKSCQLIEFKVHNTRIRFFNGMLSPMAEEMFCTRETACYAVNEFSYRESYQLWLHRLVLSTLHND